MDFVLESHIQDGGVQIVSGPQGTVPLMFYGGVDPIMGGGFKCVCVWLCVTVYVFCYIYNLCVLGAKNAQGQMVLKMYVHVCYLNV